MQKLRPILSALVGSLAGILLLVVVRFTILADDPASPPAQEEPASEASQNSQVDESSASARQAPTGEQTVTAQTDDQTDRQEQQRFPALPNPASSVAMARQMLDALEPLPTTQDRDVLRRTELDAETDGAIREGDLALADGDPQQAIKHFRSVLDHAPDNEDALAGLAMAYLMAEKYQQAIPIYERLTELRPADGATWHNLALAHLRTGETYEAERIYIRLLDTEPEFIEARANLAMIYQASGKLQYAAREWRKVVELDEDRPAAWSHLGEVLLDLNEADAAVAAYGQAAKRQENVVSVWLNYATAAQEAGRGGLALVALNRAIDLAPYDAETWRIMGDVKLEIYRATENKAMLSGAIDAWRRSLELNADQPDLKRRIKLYVR